MRHYASIPFGGKNITEDIKSESQISERLAENIKLGFGACMPEKLQSMGEKILHIRSNSTEPDMKLPVKYLSEIITARVEEIMMAILYEIHHSGFADSLRSGIVITGGCAQMANLGNFIYDISGFRVRTGYAQNLFSHSGCEGLNETSATTSLGLLLAAKDDMGNCAHGEDTVEVVVPDTDNPFNFHIETMHNSENSVKEDDASENEAQDEAAAKIEDLVQDAPSEAAVHKEEEVIQTTIFKREEIEEVPVKKVNKPKESRFKVIWKKLTESAGNLYENVNQDIDNENV
jgi:cell division protein FtsA